MKILLRYGADPRICYGVSEFSKEGNFLFDEWDISVTNGLLKHFFIKHIENKKKLIIKLESKKKEAFEEYKKTKAEYEQSESRLDECEKEIEKMYKKYFSDIETYKPLLGKITKKKEEMQKVYNYFVNQYNNAIFVQDDIKDTLEEERICLNEKQIILKKINDKEIW